MSTDSRQIISTGVMHIKTHFLQRQQEAFISIDHAENAIFFVFKIF